MKGLVHLVLFILVLVVCSCRTVHGPTRIDTIEYADEIRTSLEDAYARLQAVGAHVSMPRHIRVSFRPGDINVRDGWGFRYRDSVVGGLTIGKIVIIATTPDGKYQPFIARAELSHSLLRGTEESDYAWMRKAGLMP